MNTILDAIKLYPQDFIDTLESCAETIPNAYNKLMHENLIDMIGISDWRVISQLLTSTDYQRPLEGVIFTLNKYSSIDKMVWHDIAELYEEDKLV